MTRVTRSKVVSSPGAPTKRFSRACCIGLVALLLAIPVGYYLIPPVRDLSPQALTRELGQVESAIRDNRNMLNLLEAHAGRLKAVAGDAQSYRLPVMIQGRSTYLTLTAGDLDELSRTLALEDLLVRHRATKGHSLSVSDTEWKAILVKASEESKGHLQRTELLAIQDRMEEMKRETSKLEDRRRALLQNLQGSAADS